jgi:hypothetical protein
MACKKEPFQNLRWHWFGYIFLKYFKSIPEIVMFFFYFQWSETGSLGTAATTGLFYQPQMIDDGDCGENWQGELKYSEKTLLELHFVHHKSHMTRPGFEPGLPRWEASD